jgi:hypothetical protein
LKLLKLYMSQTVVLGNDLIKITLIVEEKNLLCKFYFIQPLVNKCIEMVSHLLICLALRS